MYLISVARTRQRAAQLENRDPISGLRETLGLFGVLSERLSNLIDTDSAVIQNSGKWIKVLRIRQHLVKTVRKIEQSLENLTEKSAVFQFCEQVIKVSAHRLDGIKDYDGVVSRISNNIVSLVSEATNDTIPATTSRKVLKKTSQRTFELQNSKDELRMIQLSQDKRLLLLNEDVELTVVYIEQLYNTIKSETDFLGVLPTLLEYFKELASLMEEAHNIAVSAGQLLTVETQRRLAMQVINIVVDETQTLRETEGVDAYNARMDLIWDDLANLRGFKPIDQGMTIAQAELKRVEEQTRRE
jgi:hypothetical protein